MDHGNHTHALEILFHPYLVHFPIAFFFLEAFLILLWLWKKEERYEQFAYLTEKLALISLPFVMMAGYVDAGGLPVRLRSHFASAVCLLLLNALRLFLRARCGPGLWTGKRKAMAFALLAASVLLTGLTGHLGGLLVYR